MRGSGSPRRARPGSPRRRVASARPGDHLSAARERSGSHGTRIRAIRQLPVWNACDSVGGARPYYRVGADAGVSPTLGRALVFARCASVATSRSRPVSRNHGQSSGERLAPADALASLPLGHHLDRAPARWRRRSPPNAVAACVNPAGVKHVSIARRREPRLRWCEPSRSGCWSAPAS
jgi:hypothetical protein